MAQTLKRALITGITGQDGSYLSEHLLSLGYEVHGIVRRVALEDARHRLSRLAGVLDRIHLHAASLESFASLYQVMAKVKPDELYHLAAQSFVSYSFDDSNSTQIQHYAEMNALGVRFTFYMWTGKTDASNSIWATAVKDGHEIGNHTKSHSSNGTTDDITAATDFIKQKYGVDAYTMAAPNGAPVYTNLAKPLFLINRGVGNGLIGAGTSDNSDAYTLPTYIPPTGASTSAFNQQVDDARSAGKWRTMCIHGFQGGNDGAYQPVPFDQFIASVQHAKSLGDVWIDSIANVGAYWQGQKAVAQATSTTSGSDKTFTWKLPAHFPPGRYLRVKVDGGTLKQNGQALTWDSHGYYEIALDALSATLSP